MSRLVLLLMLILALPANAKKHKVVDAGASREMQAAMWEPVIMRMFADAGPTTIKLVKHKLVITNPNCNEPNVKAILAETFAPAKAKLKELDMTVQCVVNTMAMN